ncbi:S8 family serine peptidase [Chitinophaga agrisoli]|uniref:S8 family serine peptidase n=1 Tax=Chitinophaga agrisoli TaxID=2607653 RepID=A0A5B2VW76_9BACT|nr:S8 family serine peptidase [Chitinophaga agrisoli]KAA2243561.1 S8 family serine peptidase [Chitinophaga agrisoli]
MTGYSIHIGLNHLDEQHYPGVPTLRAAVNDAVFWRSYAEQQGYKALSLHDGEARADAVLQALAGCAGQMQPGDILLLTYAGHGGVMPNDKPAGFDNERNDQTWCLYDRQLLDDELYEAFEAFPEGARILVISDSCHSGTITRVADTDLSRLLGKGMAAAAGARGILSRQLSDEVQERTLEKNEDAYKAIQDKYRVKKQAAGVKAAVKLLAACQDDQETLDGANNGIFTEAFMSILPDPAYATANCEMLMAAVRNRYQFPVPNFFQYGGIIDAFDYGFPFAIDIPNAATVTGHRDPILFEPATRTVAAPEQWDTLALQTPAVLLTEIEGDLKGDFAGGTDVNILSHKKTPTGTALTLEVLSMPAELGWSAAHALQTQLAALHYTVSVEPLITVNPAQREKTSREGDANNPDYIQEWPPSLLQGKVGIGWHLDDAHSQLTKARDFVLAQNAEAHVRVGHIDTGYIQHTCLPVYLNREAARSFINGEDENPAIDLIESGQDGHGLGTITLLAGYKTDKAATFGEFEGYIGGVPFAEVIPMRVSESVVIFNSNNFCEAVDYAIEQECEVISMSMAGKPSKRMARAINRAYESGIVMVTAASNCWYKGPGALLPKCVMFPAAFERVIAATGAMYNHQPYDVNFLQQSRFNITTKYMQGSWGPASRMTRALAAYTPNTPWASTVHPFVRSGGGTSSATPQVAAAAAIWIAHHRDAMEAKGYYKKGQQWKKVEAVRYALYRSAAKEAAFPEWRKYYGNGILRAYDALQVGVPDEQELKKAPEAESSIWGITQLVSSFFANRQLFRANGPKPEPEALAHELLDLLYTDPQFYGLVSTIDLGNEAGIKALVEDAAFRQKVLQSPYASPYLKETMVA